MLDTGPRYSSDEAGDGPLEDPLCQGMGPEYSSDEAGDGPDSSEEYIPLDRKAKRRLIQRQYNRKRKKLRSKAKQFSRNANPTVRARHNASANTARDTNASKRARDSKLEQLARERDPQKKERHNASAHTARDTSASKRARDSKLERLPRDYDLWSSDALPEDDLIKQFELNPYVAAAAFRMMGGLPEDARICPRDMSFKVDIENMINRWKAEVGHDVDIRVCFNL